MFQHNPTFYMFHQLLGSQCAFLPGTVLERKHRVLGCRQDDRIGDTAGSAAHPGVSSEAEDDG